MKILFSAIVMIVLSCNIIADNNISTKNIESAKYSIQEHGSKTNSFTVQSLPVMKIEVTQPVNWYLILLPITTIVIVIAGFLITLTQIIRKSEESIRTSKMEVLSKNRQAWINTLRDDISNFIGQVDFVQKNVSLHYKEDSTEAEKVTAKEVILGANKMREQKSKIELLINPNEEKHIKLVTLLELTIDNLQKRINNDINIKNITILAQEILKEEWTRVKRGD
ncbi:MAG: hypothetical protein PHO27_09935 [Sulfuricurvum sp.]|nr:hypothetical protein [Sulfuricurvum sp.]